MIFNGIIAQIIEFIEFGLNFRYTDAKLVNLAGGSLPVICIYIFSSSYKTQKNFICSIFRSAIHICLRFNK